MSFSSEAKKEIAADLQELIKAAMEMHLIFREKEAIKCQE